MTLVYLLKPFRGKRPQQCKFLLVFAGSLLQQSKPLTNDFAGVFVLAGCDQLIDKLDEVFSQIHILGWHT